LRPLFECDHDQTWSDRWALIGDRRQRRLIVGLRGLRPPLGIDFGRQAHEMAVERVAEKFGLVDPETVAQRCASSASPSSTRKPLSIVIQICHSV
jgi:hypothetical protein